MLCHVMLCLHTAWINAKKDKNWTYRNYLSHRSLLHAASVRDQLVQLLNKLAINTHVSCLPEKEPFLRCLTSGLFLNSARLVDIQNSNNKYNSNNSSSNGSKNGHQQIGSSSGSSGEDIPPNTMKMTSKFTDRYKSNYSYNNNKTVPIVRGSSQNGQNGLFEKETDSETAPYRTIKDGLPVHIHPSSVLFSGPYSRKLPPYIIYSELLITSKRYMRGVAAIDGQWLTELVPEIFAHK